MYLLYINITYTTDTYHYFYGVALVDIYGYSYAINGVKNIWVVPTTSTIFNIIAHTIATEPRELNIFLHKTTSSAIITKINCNLIRYI
jgi:hypothetical protein